MIKYIMKNKKGLSLVIIAIVITSVISYINRDKEVFSEPIEFVYTKVEEPKVLTEEEIYAMFLDEKSDKIDFYAQAFKIEKEKLNTLLIDNKDQLQLMDNEDKLDYIIINYLLNLEKTNRDYFDNSLTPAAVSKDYMVKLIKYLCNFYDVDFNIAAAIPEIESGYSARGMLNVNNIFGGMSGSGLIRYKTIEYGIIRYIVMLNDGYFSKGLNTVEKIGYIYNPTINENGQKIANPHWVANVNNAKSHYNDVPAITDVNQIMEVR